MRRSSTITAGIALLVVATTTWLSRAQNAAAPSGVLRLSKADARGDGRVTQRVDVQFEGARAVGHVLLSVPLRSYDDPAEVVRAVSYSITVIRDDGTCATLSSIQVFPQESTEPVRTSVGRASETFDLRIQPGKGLTWGGIATPDDLHVEFVRE